MRYNKTETVVIGHYWKSFRRRAIFSQLRRNNFQ